MGWGEIKMYAYSALEAWKLASSLDFQTGRSDMYDKLDNT